MTSWIKGNSAPHLAAVLVGEDPASETYVNNKEKSCREVVHLIHIQVPGGNS